ncbi:hypothetical protein [Bradyrhizobium genosp. P]|uniref:hypothetical protein n=1 Tax=Bradyrhizobium genosp. P TaxID=83641 RepID=UPI003CF9086C
MTIAIKTGYADTERASSAEDNLRIDDHPIRADYWLAVALEDSFPCSDPISSMRID